MRQPACPDCGHLFAWREILRQVFGPSRSGTALWGARCPSCGADLKVPNGRMLLIAAAGLFFGSQSSTILLVSQPPPVLFWVAKLGLILGFYAIAVVIFLRLERAE